jgi:hypothetical protein
MTEETWYDVTVSHEWHCTYKVKAIDRDAAWRLVDRALACGVVDPAKDCAESFYPDMEVDDGLPPRWGDIVVEPGKDEESDPTRTTSKDK